jgi:hypothetical protein
VRDHGLDIEARECLVDQLERPLCLLQASHRASIAQGLETSAGGRRLHS